MEEVEAVCSKLIIMDKGRIIEEGDKEEIKLKYEKQGLNSLEDIFLSLTGTELRD
jgi:ABC-type Na+ transport system ATPase subunit NatA